MMYDSNEILKSGIALEESILKDTEYLAALTKKVNELGCKLTEKEFVIKEQKKEITKLKESLDTFWWLGIVGLAALALSLGIVTSNGYFIGAFVVLGIIAVVIFENKKHRN